MLLSRGKEARGVYENGTRRRIFDARSRLRRASVRPIPSAGPRGDPFDLHDRRRLHGLALNYLTHRNDLISKNKDYYQRWTKYIQEFGDDEDLVAVVEGGERDADDRGARRDRRPRRCPARALRSPQLQGRSAAAAQSLSALSAHRPAARHSRAFEAHVDASRTARHRAYRPLDRLETSDVLRVDGQVGPRQRPAQSRANAFPGARPASTATQRSLQKRPPLSRRPGPIRIALAKLPARRGRTKRTCWPSRGISSAATARSPS